MTLKFKLKIKNPTPAKLTERYDPRIHGIRQSMLSIWMECREKARLCIIEGWRDKAASMPLTYGTLSHGVLKSVYRGLRDGNINSLDSVKQGMDIFIAESEKEWLKEVKMPTTLQNQIKEEACCILGKKLPHYFDRWWQEDTSVTWSMVEDKFMVPIHMDDGATVPLIGTFDGSYKKLQTNHLWLFETKNKSRWGDDIGTLLPLDLQVGIYLTALHALYNVSPVGVRYNILRRPGERRKKEESLLDFASRIESNIIKDPGHYFHRFEVELTEEEKEEHVARTEALCQAFYNWWKESQITLGKRDLLWNSSSCDGKYGTCKMLTACANKDFTPYKQEAPAAASGHESFGGD